MAYAIDRGESIHTAVTRILIELIDRAAAQLGEKRIHDARKRFKEIRAVLRMVRASLGAQFAIENVWFRDAGRDLAAARDADALVEAAVKLRQSARTVSDKRLLSRVRRVLSTRRDEALGRDVEARIVNLLEQLPVAKARLATISALEDRFATIGSGLARTYSDGRRAFDRARNGATDAEIHEWRKRVKDHWYHVQLLRHVWPEMMKPYGEIMAQLSSTLGDRHDLDVLRSLIERDPVAFGSAASVRRLLHFIDSRRDELLAAAILLGSRVYSEDAGSWRKRIRGYWRASRS